MILGVIFKVHLVKAMTVMVGLWVGLAKSTTDALFSSGDLLQLPTRLCV